MKQFEEKLQEELARSQVISRLSKTEPDMGKQADSYSGTADGNYEWSSNYVEHSDTEHQRQTTPYSNYFGI